VGSQGVWHRREPRRQDRSLQAAAREAAAAVSLNRRELAELQDDELCGGGAQGRLRSGGIRSGGRPAASRESAAAV
jgi:hypothetical protein